MITAQEKSTGKLVKESLDHVREIFRSEVRLVKAEAAEEARLAARAGVMASIGLLLGALGVNFLLWAVVWALAPEMPNWLASLIVGAASLVAAAIAGWTARSQFQQIQPPEQTEQTMKENIEWAKNRA